MSGLHSLPASKAIVLFVALLDKSPDMLKGVILLNDKSELLNVSLRHFRGPEDPHGNAHRHRGRGKNKMNRCKVVQKDWRNGESSRLSDAHATSLWGRV